MISVKDISAYNYESIDGTTNGFWSTKKLTTLSGNNNDVSGLIEEDLVKPINSRGFFYMQSCDFTPVTIKTFDGAGSIVLEDKIGQWYDVMTQFIIDYKLTGTYDLTTLAGMQYFYNNIKESDAPEFFGTNTVDELKISC